MEQVFVPRVDPSLAFRELCRRRGIDEPKASDGSVVPNSAYSAYSSILNTGLTLCTDSCLRCQSIETFVYIESVCQ